MVGVDKKGGGGDPSGVVILIVDSSGGREQGAGPIDSVTPRFQLHSACLPERSASKINATESTLLTRLKAPKLNRPLLAHQARRGYAGASAAAPH